MYQNGISIVVEGVMKRLLSVVLLLFCAGCAMAVPERNVRYFWPQLPDQPRIEWLKAFSSQLDIEKTGPQRFWAAISGDDAPVGLVKPVEVKSLPGLNRFYVSDVGRSAVVVFDLAAHEVRTLSVPKGVPPLIQPSSIVADAAGNLYILERRSASIHVFDRLEKFSHTIDLKSAPIRKPVTLAINSGSSRLYVADADSRAIYVLDYQGKVLNRITSGAGADNPFILPIGIAITSKGHIVVADSFGAMVQLFDSEGRFLRKFGRRGDGLGDFQLIKAVAVDSSDNIYVVDGRSHSISIHNEQGELLFVLGGYYTTVESGKLAPGGFSIPVGIDIDATDRIFVVDQMNGRVQVFQYFSEEYLRKTPVP